MNKNDLPDPVREDLFNLECSYPEMATVYIGEQVEAYGFTPGDTSIKGVLISLPFNHAGVVSGAITVNRLERNFSVEAGDGKGTFLPVTGEWRDVRTYLANLQRTLAQ